MAERFDPERALQLLQNHGVRFIVIGGVAANAAGSPVLTQDLDICYARDLENLLSLAEALNAMHATLRGAPPGLPFILDAETLRNGDSFTFDTDFGGVDILGTPKGTEGFADLAANSWDVVFQDSLQVRVASLPDLMRMKQAAGRAKDREQLEWLEAIRQQTSAAQDKPHEMSDEAP